MQASTCQTPDVSRSRPMPSWLADLEAYISSHEAAPGGDRNTLVSNVKSNPKSAEAWRSLLGYEETHGANNTHNLQLASTADNSNKVSLYHIYYWATQLVPRNKNQQKEAYLWLWLGFARQQWVRSQEDARDTFKTLKNQLVGEGSALLYHEWASLEHAAGNVSKALGIIAKGLKSDAQPPSILEHLRVEMQSGTFDLKAAGSYTETLTIDASSATARQLQQSLATPAPAGVATVKPVSGCNKGSGPASGACHKDVTAAPLVCVRPHPPEQGGRAVTFAADVHGNAPSNGESGRRSGSVGASSNQSVRRLADAHTSCLSTSSLSSRSSTSVHDGTLPFLSGTVSYKSSTTESCSMGGLEEDTISCQAADLVTEAAGKGPPSKPSTAPVSLQHAQDDGTTQGGSASSSNTATLGLKRFGFKSRALRVGSAADAPAKAPQPSVDTVIAGSAAPGSPMPPPPPIEAASSSSAPSASNRSPAVQASVDEEDAATTGRKRRAADGHRSDLSEEDSVPVESSKPAAQVAHKRHTPLAAGRQHCARGDGLSKGPSASPAEGQLPSSMDNTPEPVPLTVSMSGPADSTPKLLGSLGIREPDSQLSFQGQAAGTASGTCSKLPTNSACHSAEACKDGAAAAEVDVHEQPLPTVTPDVLLPLSTTPNRQPSSTSTSQKQQTVQPSWSRAVPLREPFRPLQYQQTLGSSSRLEGHAVQSSMKVGSAAVEVGLALGGREQPQEQGLQHHLPEAQKQKQQQVPAIGPPLSLSVQQQQVLRQSRPREDAQTVFVQGVRYTKLECVGRGGSSKVFKVMGPSCKIFALKRIRLAGRDAEAASGFIDEINLLQRLKNKPNIIQLVESQVFQEEGLIYMVQEYGEIDLARLLAKHDAVRRAASNSGGSGGLLPDTLDENFVRLYWQQMLQAVSGVHAQRIVHSDLKPANFLLVEGQLKLIDFGIAKAISGDTTSIARESQVGTLNYMSPEAILGGSNNILGGPAMKVGRPSDVWSLGCILYQMVYGRTPFADLPFLAKMHAICSPQHQVAYPKLANGDLLDVMKRCLDRNPKTRITLQELLDHSFLHPNRSRLSIPAHGAPMGLSEAQMKLLVSQVAAAGAAGVTDIDKLTKELMHKLGTAPHSTA